MKHEVSTFDSAGRKILTLEDLTDVVAGLRGQEKTIVLANGVFDLLHVGHVRYLEGAATQGDVLVVAVNSDASTRAYKGPSRPIVPERERLELVSALECVDYVICFDEPTVTRIIEATQPDVQCKGTDYNEDNVPEKDAVLAYGGRVAITGDPKDHNSSDMIARLRGDDEFVSREGHAIIDFIVDKRVFFGGILAFLFLFFAKPHTGVLYIGVPIAVIGAAIRTWAAGYIQKTKSLAKTGPYAFTRNPLYFGSFLMLIGSATAAGNTVILLSAALLFGLTYREKIAREQKHLLSLFGDEYRDFVRNVPAFFPRFSPAYPGAGKFDWSLALGKNKEWQAWLGLSALLIYLVFLL